MGKRIHRTLGLEELEPRVAPVTLSATNSTLTFTDMSGDQVQLKYTGPGKADLWFFKSGWTSPGMMDNLTDIKLSGTTSSSTLTIIDLNPGTGGDSLEGGNITGAAGESFGTIQLLAGAKGTVSNTKVDVKQNVGTMLVQGNADKVNLTVGINLTKQVFQGDASNCQTMVYGNASLYQITGTMTTCKFGAKGNVSSFQVGKDMIGSITQILGDAPNVHVSGSVATSVLAAGGAAKMTITGGVTYAEIAAGNMQYFSAGSMTTAAVGGFSSLGTIYCKGDMTFGRIVSKGNANSIQIGGNVTGGLNGAPTIEIAGNLNSLTISGNLKESGVLVAGNLGAATVQGATHAAMLWVFGNLSNATFSKAMTWSMVGVAGTANALQFNGNVANSFIAVGGKTTTFKTASGLKDSWLWLAGGADNVYLNGGVNNSLAGIGGSSMKLLQITGGLTNGSHITVGEPSAQCNVTTTTIDGGINNANLTVHGNTNLLKVTGGIQGASTLDITGQVTTAQLYGTTTVAGVAAGATVKMGSLQSSLLVTYGLAGTVDIVGSAASANITVNGDLTGSLLAGVFGNVTVNGNFTGQIGDSGTAPGAGTLKVTGSPIGGAVTPGTAFANYIW